MRITKLSRSFLYSFVLLLICNYHINAQEVKIGTQVWTSKNLDITRFRNGDTIMQERSYADWTKALDSAKPAWCYYNYDSANGKIYGKLYNWYAVNDPRGLAPLGWHIPKATDFQTLIDYLGGTATVGTKLKSTTGWGEDGNGTDSSGFAGLPGGSHAFMQSPEGIGALGAWWSAEGMVGGDAWGFALFKNASYGWGHSDARSRLAVRCIKDSK